LISGFIAYSFAIKKRMECSDRIYHQNDLGCSRRCTCHNAVHLNFGNISLLLSKTQLEDFAKYMYEAVTSCLLDGDEPDARDIYIPTRDLCIHFVLSFNELKALLDLSEQTLLCLQIDEALLL
jgi:hypothetical protein